MTEPLIAVGGMYENGCIETYENGIPDVEMTPLSFLRNTALYPMLITLECLEVTTFCKITKQPDYGKIVIEFVPDKLVVETKALKLYLVTFRTAGIFQEEVCQKIYHDLWTQMAPKLLRVTGTFNNRGGIEETICVDQLYGEAVRGL